MELKIRNYKIELIPLILILLSLFLIFYNLGLRRFWLDECVSNILAKNILKYGYPSVYDGTYFMTALNGNDSNEYAIEAWYSWLPFYIQALFRWLFGDSEFVLRLPNAIFGFVSVVYFHLCLKQLSENKLVQNLSLLFYIFCIPLLVYIRTSHYYAGVLCFTNMSLYYLFKMIKHKQQLKYQILFCVTMILFFHNNFGMFLIPAFAYGVYILLAKPGKNLLIRFFIIYFIVALFTGPWFIYILKTTQGTKSGFFIGITTLQDTIGRCFVYIWKLHTFFFPIISLLIIYGILLIVKKFVKISTTWESEKKIIILGGIFLFSDILINILFEPFSYSRRLLPIIGMSIIFGTVIIYRIFNISKILGSAVIIIVFTTNLLNILPWKILGSIDYPFHKHIAIQSPVTLQTLIQGNTLGYLKNEYQFRWPLIDLYNELTTDVTNRTDAIIDCLNENALPGEVMVCTNVEAPKLYYYTGLKVVNQLDPEGSAYGPLGRLYYKDYPNARKYRHLDYVPDEEVDWIIYQDLIPFPFEDPDYLKKNEIKFEKIYIDVSNAFIESTSEMDNHMFRQKPNCKGFYIYHKW